MTPCAGVGLEEDEFFSDVVAVAEFRWCPLARSRVAGDPPVVELRLPLSQAVRVQDDEPDMAEAGFGTP